MEAQYSDTQPDYQKPQPSPLEAVAWSALAVETLAVTSGTVGLKEGRQGNTLAQAAAAIVLVVASHTWAVEA